jgi:transcriptional regulator with XRE-family HTH domain
MSTTTNKTLLSELLAGIDPKEQAKTDKRMTLATKIANGIKAKGLKKKEFAERMGKVPSEISKWLSGTHNFTSDTLMDIEAELGIKLINLDNWTNYEKFEKVEVKSDIKQAPIYRLAG